MNNCSMFIEIIVVGMEVVNVNLIFSFRYMLVVVNIKVINVFRMILWMVILCVFIVVLDMVIDFIG